MTGTANAEIPICANFLKALEINPDFEPARINLNRLQQQFAAEAKK